MRAAMLPLDFRAHERTRLRTRIAKQALSDWTV